MSRATTLGLEHVVERVVERPQVRVDLRQHVAGQEAEPLPRLDRGPGEDDAVHCLRLQRLHRERDREVALAGAGRADRERDRVVAHRVDVALLAGGLRAGSLLRPAHDLGGEHFGRALVGLQHRRSSGRGPSRSSSWPCSSSTTSSSKSRPTRSASARVAGDVISLPAHEDLHRERGLDHAQQLVALAEQAHHEVVARDQDLDVRWSQAGWTFVAVPRWIKRSATRPEPDSAESGRVRSRIGRRGRGGRAARGARRARRCCGPCTTRAPAGRSAGS